MVDEFSEGLSRATREAAGEGADGLNDNRLAVQLGMLFGVLYLAFLSVWFWATRVRMEPARVATRSGPRSAGRAR